MTNIHFPVDGQGTHSLKKQNKSDKSPFHVDATEPDVKNQNKKNQNKPPAKQNYQNTSAELPAESRQHPKTEPETERRQNNRRQKNTSILLNTRSEQERRKSSSQRDEDLKDNNNQFGIDTEA